MTNVNYTEMSNQELLDIIDLELSRLHSPNKSTFRFRCYELYSELVKRTSFLDNEVQDTLPGRIFCLRNNIHESPRCSICGKPVRYSKKYGRFNFTCSWECSFKDPNRQQRLVETCRLKYNVDNPFQAKEIKEKIKRTMVERHGVEHALQSESIRQKFKETSKEHFGVEHPMKSKMVMDRMKNTNLQNLGVEYTFQSKEVQEKSRQTCVERFGVDNAFKSEEVQMKRSATMLQRYDVEYTLQSKELTEKVKEAMMRKFGVEHPMQSEEIKQRTMETNQIRFGVDHPMKLDKFKQRSIDNNKSKHGGIHSSSVPEVKAKVAATNMQRYGVTCSLQNDVIDAKARKSMLEHHGAEYPLQCKDIREKIRETLLKTKGVEHPSQTYEFHKNKKHKFHSDKYPGLTFDSTWEVKVYEFCRDNNIPVEYSPSISYEYEYDGRICTYHPDFLINGKIYEIKGDYFFRINESTGKEEMFCPYKGKNWTDKEYELKCELYEAKHQCMLSNNVIILRGKDIDNLSIEMFSSSVS